MSFMQQWYDESLPPTEDWSTDAYMQDTLFRYAKTAFMAQAAADVPKRLGADADPKDQAKDKKFSKKIRSLYKGLVNAQGDDADDMMNNLDNHEELITAGAQVDWHAWHLRQLQFIGNALRIVATNATNAGDFRLGNKICNMLQNEILILNNAYERVFGPVRDPETGELSA